MLIAIILCGVTILMLGIMLVIMSNQTRQIRGQFSTLTTEKTNYESIIDQANDAMFVIDIVDGKIHQANPSAAELLGYSQPELLKKSLFNLHPEEYLDKSSRLVADVWEKGGLIYRDIPFRTRTGELLPVECSAKVAPFAGRPAIVIYARDIRERIRMEKEITDQKEIIEQKNKSITESIEYAQNIQEAILPNRENLKNYVNDAFILYMPKDIVSGDFYWYVKKNGNLLFAAVDCTGHGVPGALMSIIGNSGLNDIVNSKAILKPAEILNQLRDDVIYTLRRADMGHERKDGMDIALCNLETSTNTLQYAGAFNSLWIVRKGIENSDLVKEGKASVYADGVAEVKADKFPVGTFIGRELVPFTNNEIPLQKGDCVYIFTDGYADQFGGPKGKKFKYKQLLNLLSSVSEKPMHEQKAILRKTTIEWKGNLEQVDDVLIIGVRV
ncbi:MAG: PP2C family protein-serine/threonine phosphatase [Bacteroidia bacterium]